MPPPAWSYSATQYVVFPRWSLPRQKSTTMFIIIHAWAGFIGMQKSGQKLWRTSRRTHIQPDAHIHIHDYTTTYVWMERQKDFNFITGLFFMIFKRKIVRKSWAFFHFTFFPRKKRFNFSNFHFSIKKSFLNKFYVLLFPR